MACWLLDSVATRFSFPTEQTEGHQIDQICISYVIVDNKHSADIVSGPGLLTDAAMLISLKHVNVDVNNLGLMVIMFLLRKFIFEYYGG